jgi:hypothetical protein
MWLAENVGAEIQVAIAVLGYQRIDARKIIALDRFLLPATIIFPSDERIPIKAMISPHIRQ